MDRKYGFGVECWEAEAGDPALIASIIRARAAGLVDADVLAEVAQRERTARHAFADLAIRLDAA